MLFRKHEMRNEHVQPDILPTVDHLLAYSRNRYGDVNKHGWRVRMRHRFGYFAPEASYEVVVDRLVKEGTRWIDAGGGKTVFPHNEDLSRALSQRCNLLVGVDPSGNVAQNPFVHERAQCTIEEYDSERSFDLVTLRMVAEHISEPDLAVAALARLVRPGGHVVIYTPNRWSPVSLAAAMIPNRLHQPITKLLWRTKEEDVFPTFYRMNTRKELRTHFEKGGFKEVAFAYLDSCYTFQRFRWSCYLELALWRMFQAIGLKYPETNLLGVYEKA